MIKACLITEDFHYVAWYTWDHQDKQAGTQEAVELYDLGTDPAENRNLANQPDNKDIRRDLARRLKEGWPGFKGS